MLLDNFILSEGISVDQTSNSVSVFNILEEVRVPELPVFIPSLTVLSVWRREDSDTDSDYQCLLRVTRPGHEAENFPTNFQVPGLRHRTIHRLQGLPIEQVGNLQFEVLLNGNRKGEYVIPVVIDDSIATPPATR